jgi:hypothetical protein
MKKTIAITSALAAASSLATAEIKINEFLSFAGFVDASYSHYDAETNGNDASDNNTFGVDEVEIDWMFNFGKVTAQIDLQYEGGRRTDSRGGDNGSGSDTAVEQAFVNYDLGNGASVTVGRYESMLGLEAKEPTGLYQFSKAYANSQYGDQSILPQYAQGVKYTGQSGDLSYGISLQDESFDNDEDSFGGPGGSDGSYAIEAAASLVSGAITYSLGGAFEDGDDRGDTWVVNGHAVYQDGPWTLGAELNIGNSENFAGLAGLAGSPTNDLDALSGLVMANYAYSDCCSVTGRISYLEFEDGSFGLDSEAWKYTLAHNYALTDNLAIITEVSYLDGENGNTDYDELLGAVEVLFTF